MSAQFRPNSTNQQFLRSFLVANVNGDVSDATSCPQQLGDKLWTCRQQVIDVTVKLRGTGPVDMLSTSGFVDNIMFSYHEANNSFCSGRLLRLLKFIRKFGVTCVTKSNYVAMSMFVCLFVSPLA